MKTVTFKTFGCRLNQAETARFEAELAAFGIMRVPFSRPSDAVIVHTCAVTQKAENECVKFLHFVRREKAEARLVVVGCAVKACGDDALRGLGADLVVAQDQKAELAATVARLLGIERPPSPVVPLQTTHRATLKVQDGCDFFCTYCIVPHTRGAPVSFPFEGCLREAKTLIAAGFQEIVVTGCNLACYRDGDRTLVDLLRALLELPGLGRIRLGSLEPGTVEREIVSLMAESPRFCKFLHLAVQSGDDRILADMRRRYTADHLADTLREALRRMPRLGLGADLICGFPGETTEAFSRTRAFVETFPFSNLHVFPYSERPGTPAATFPDSVPFRERKRRTRALIELSKEKRAAFARSLVGHPLTFLMEHLDENGYAYGWSEEYMPCVASGVPAGRMRTLCTFTPTSAGDEALYGDGSPTAAGTAQSD